VARNPKLRRLETSIGAEIGMCVLPRDFCRAPVCNRAGAVGTHAARVLRRLERRLAFRAVRNVASFGTRRRLGPRAVRNSAPL